MWYDLKISLMAMFTIAFFWGCPGCNDDNDANPIADTGTETGDDTASDIDSDTASGIDTDTPLNTDTRGDTDTVGDSDTGTGSDRDTETESDSATATGDTTGTDSNGDATCAQITQLKPGMNYGNYSLFAIRVNDATAPGQYSVRTTDSQKGTASVFLDNVLIDQFTYDPTASLENTTQQTVAVSNLFELDIRSTTELTLGALDQSIFDGCHVVVISDFTEISAEEIYGPFLVEEFTVPESLESGTYVFYVESGNAGTVVILRDDVEVDSLNYEWTTSLGPDVSYTFEFQSGVILKVTRASGTSNLFPIAASLFDGRHGFVVP